MVQNIVIKQSLFISVPKINQIGQKEKNTVRSRQESEARTVRKTVRMENSTAISAKTIFMA